MHWYFHALEVGRRRRFQFVHSLQTERTCRFLYHIALFYEFCFVPGTKLSFVTGIDHGCRVEVRRHVLVVTYTDRFGLPTYFCNCCETLGT
jgi:hypothetical protein